MRMVGFDTDRVRLPAASIEGRRMPLIVVQSIAASRYQCLMRDMLQALTNLLKWYKFIQITKFSNLYLEVLNHVSIRIVESV